MTRDSLPRERHPVMMPPPPRTNDPTPSQAPHPARSPSCWNPVRAYYLHTIISDSPLTAVPSIHRTIPSLKNLVETFIRTFLRTQDESISFTASYQDVFNACKILVLEANEAPLLAAILDRSLKTCAVEIMKGLINFGEGGLVQWLDEFDGRWHWWCRRLVSLILSTPLAGA